MVYSNADITKAGQAAEIIAFADYWKAATGADPGLLVFDSQLTTYKVLEELSARGITWLTLRQRGKTELARLADLPASEWKTYVIARSGRYRRPRMHEDMVKLTGISSQVRQIAIKNIGRDEPTLLITNDTAGKGKDLFARYAERMMIENELDAYIGGFHLDALTSGVSLNVDLDTTLTVVAGNLYRLLALKLARYEHATPGTLWRDFLDATGTLHIDDTGVTCALNLRSHHPVLIDAGFADLQTPILWWDGRTLRFRFLRADHPPRPETSTQLSDRESRLVDSCNFGPFLTIERQFTFIDLAPAGTRVRWSPDAPRAGRGRLGLPAFPGPGAAGGSALKAGLGVYMCQAAGRFAVVLRSQPGLDAEGRPRTLARRVPRPRRGSPFLKVSGGEAASFLPGAAQRPAALTRPPVPRRAPRPPGASCRRTSAAGRCCTPRSRRPPWPGPAPWS